MAARGPRPDQQPSRFSRSVIEGVIASAHPSSVGDQHSQRPVHDVRRTADHVLTTSPDDPLRPLPERHRHPR